MNNLFTYLLELNLSLVILYTAYRILFGKDRNFRVRRTYLMVALVIPFFLPLAPALWEISAVNIMPLSLHLEEFTIIGTGAAYDTSHSLSPAGMIRTFYIIVVGLGFLKLLIQLAGIFHTITRSEKRALYGIPFYSGARLHASSFFGFIFADTSAAERGTLQHILEHEQTHKKEWHSLDRILAELLVVINWFNPVAWMFRRAVIENHEFLADSAVLRKGTDPVKYQLSILNQYIGSASIANQFSNQIKNRIKMLNRDYKLGSWWKITAIFPIVFIALIIVSCNEKETLQDMVPEDQEAVVSDQKPIAGDREAVENDLTEVPEDLFFVVEEMPTFNGGDAAAGFRTYITNNLQYPGKAAENNISGRVIVQFTVDKTGKVMDPVVVRGVDPLLDNEALRVISSSPDWEPGRQQGKAVNVLFTFPITFALE